MGGITLPENHHLKEPPGLQRVSIEGCQAAGAHAQGIAGMGGQPLPHMGLVSQKTLRPGGWVGARGPHRLNSSQVWRRLCG